MKKEDVQHYFVFVLLFTIICLPNLVFEAVAGTTNRMIGGLVLPICLLSVLMLPFYRRLKLYFYFLSILLILVPPSIFCAFHYLRRLNSTVMLLTVESSKQNQIQFLEQTGTTLIIAYVIIFLLYFFLLKKAPKKISLRKALVIAFGSMFFLFFSFLVKFGCSNHLSWYFKNSTKNYFPFHLVVDIPFVYNHVKVRKEYSENIKEFKFDAEKLDTLDGYEIYIFVLGESSNYYHWQINGYNRPTSPKIIQRKNLIPFPNVVSPSFFTAKSVPYILTSATTETQDIAVKEKTFLSTYQEAGFFVKWIGNIKSRGTISIDIYADELGDPIYTSSEFNPHLTTYDESLHFFLEKSIEKTNNNKLFFLLHTAGSHVIYNEQYPMSFNRFRPSGKDVEIDYYNEKHQNFIINDYDNTILYTDYVLDGLINLMKKKNAISWVLYLADHGEHMFDSNHKLPGHSEPDVSTLHVPMFLWTSPKYRDKYPEKFNAIKKNYKKELSSEDIFHTVIDMGNIYFPKLDKERSISSSKYKEKTRMVITNNGTIPYSNIKSN